MASPFRDTKHEINGLESLPDTRHRGGPGYLKVEMTDVRDDKGTGRVRPRRRPAENREILGFVSKSESTT